MNTTSTEADVKVGPCFRLLYRSKSLLDGNAADIESNILKIISAARTNNRRKNITGALVFYKHDDNFAQVLEGEESELRELYATICADKRHEQVEIIEETKAPARIFNRWSMALVFDEGEPGKPLVATNRGLSEAEPWRMTTDQEAIVDKLLDSIRGYGRGY